MRSFAPAPDHTPKQFQPRTLSDYFETIVRAMFNAGFTWQVVEAVWPHFHQALDQFDPKKVAQYEQSDLLRLLGNDKLIQSRSKLEAVISNAKRFMELVDGHNGFPGWLQSHKDFQGTQKALIEEFAYIGDYSAYWILFTWEEPVLRWEDWGPAHGYPLPE